MSDIKKIIPDQALSEFMVSPNINMPGLTRVVQGVNHEGSQVDSLVIEERPLTIYLNKQEIVTSMTVGDYPEYLAVGYLLNQNMLKPDTPLNHIDYDAELDVVVVRTAHETNYEQKLAKKIRTSGCAVGTIYGDLIADLENVHLPDVTVKTSWLYALAKKINQQPSLYLKSGAIHGCVLCQEDRPLVYMEDVGRHNAVDKIAGWMFMHQVEGGNKIFYTTGRLTSEMVIKTALMGIPVLASRSGFTASGVEIARKVGLTLIGRLRGQRFVCLSGTENLQWDAEWVPTDPSTTDLAEEP